MKKIISLVLVAVLALTAIGGTLAYFTDTESATNTFTIGSVDIQLLESQKYPQVDGSTKEDIKEDAKTYQEKYLAEQGKDIVPGEFVKKAIYIDNTGKNEAWVRIRYVVNADVFKKTEYMENRTALKDGTFTKTIVATFDNDTQKTYANIAEGDYSAETALVANANLKQVEYIFTYQSKLASGEMTDVSPLYQFRLSPALDNEDVQDWSTDSIAVYADAIQAEGFETAAEAFAAFDKQEVGDKVEDNAARPDNTDTVKPTAAPEAGEGEVTG